MEIRKSQESILEEDQTKEVQIIKGDKDVVAIQGKIQKIASEVAVLKIVNEKTGKYGTDLLSFIKTAYKNLEVKRKFFVQPLNSHIRNINAEFKILQEPLAELEKELKVKLLTWHQELRRQAEEETKRKTEEEERKRKQAEETAKALNLPEIGEQAPVEVEPESTQIRGSLGSTHIKKKWSFAVEDFSKIPDEYKQLNSPAINTAIRAGTREIPGLRIFEEDIIANR